MRGAVVIEGGPTNLDKAALAFKVISSFQLVWTVFADKNLWMLPARASADLFWRIFSRSTEDL